jgi:hypothetical protein
MTVSIPAHTLDGREGRLVYLPSKAATSVQGSFDFVDTVGNVVGQAIQNRQNLDLGHALEITLDVTALSPGGADMAIGDQGAADLAGVDLAGADLATAGGDGGACPGLFCETFDEYTQITDVDSVWAGRNADPGASLTLVSPGANGQGHAIQLALMGGSPIQANMWTIAQFSNLPVNVRFRALSAGSPPNGQTTLITYGPMSQEADVHLDSANPWGFQVGVPAGATAGTYQHATITLSPGAWHCYELRLTSSGGSFWQDGTQIAYSNYTGASVASSQLQLIVATTATSSFDFSVQFDDILVSTTSGNCP